MTLVVNGDVVASTVRTLASTYHIRPAGGGLHAVSQIDPTQLPPLGEPIPRVRALEILDAARTLGEGNRLVFPMPSGKAISMSTLPKMLDYHRIAAVPHGFRSSFRDWAAEGTDHPREVIEAALAHVVQNKVEAAYARSDLFERRRRLMDEWAAYVGPKRPR